MLSRISTLVRRLYYARQLTAGRRTVVSVFAVLDLSRGGTIQIGDRCQIRHGAIIAAAGGNVSIGDRSTINQYTIVSGSGGLFIGDDVRIGPHCVVVSENHRFSRRNVSISAQGMDKKGIEIENDVWIGANATILDGAIIRHGCVVAAGAVVRGDTQPFGVYAGVPAKRIKER